MHGAKNMGMKASAAQSLDIGSGINHGFVKNIYNL